MAVINSIADSHEEFAAIRHELHQNPQTKYEETYAADLVKKTLKSWGIPFKDNIAVTGIVATIEGQKNDSGKAIALRADMDALDIHEKSNVPHSSKIPGKMHACGHDGHTTTLLAAAKYLKDTRNFNGTVHLIFQPAEEGGRGADRMIEEGLFKDFPCDAVYGLHNWPDMPVGTIATRPGPLLASVGEFDITITGKGGHAAMPHLTADPMIAATSIVTALQTIVSRNVNPIDTAVISVTNLNVGTGAFNIIADTAHINGTVRTFDNNVRDMIARRMEEVVQGIAQACGMRAEMIYTHDNDATINSDDGVAMAATAAADIVGSENVDTDCPPSMGGEDFGAYLKEKSGAFIFVGQAKPNDKNSPHNHGLHSPFYDFNNDIIPIGASLFARIVERSLPLEK